MKLLLPPHTVRAICTMRTSSIQAILLLFFSLILGLQSVTAKDFSLAHLTVEYTETPMGIDIEKPRFAWQMQSSERDVRQSAYRLVVKDPHGNIQWDTDRVESDDALAIIYQGIDLKPRTRYHWTVEVWDADGDNQKMTSWFETGLMHSEESAWMGAQWIGGGNEDMVLESHYLSVFKVQYDLQLDEHSATTKAAFVFGANDHRLLNRDMNIMGVQTDRNGHFIAVELDVSAVDGSDEGLARVKIYRVGYSEEDKIDQPLHDLEVPLALVDQENKYQMHHFLLECVFGTVNIYLDGDQEENRLGEIQDGFFGKGGLNLNPMGSGGDFISFPMLADIGFQMNARQEALFSNLIVRHHRSPSNIIFSEELSENEYQGIFSPLDNHLFQVADKGYQVKGGQSGIFLVSNPSRNAMPMMRTEFNTEKIIAQARLYITARGVYECFINGQRVSDDVFNPGLTQYNKSHLYQTYDVSEMVHGGDNALGVRLGEGWWSGNYTFRGENWNFFGDRQSLLALLIVTYEDGSQKIVTTNDQDWQYYDDGPIRYGSFFQGEVYDARKEVGIEGWTQRGFDDQQWEPAVEVGIDSTAYLGMIRTNEVSYGNFKLIGQFGENAKVIKELTAQEVTEVRPGVFVYDMGQNMVGIPSITLSDREAGDTIRMRFAEVLYPDLDEYGDNVGMVMLENIRGAYTHDLYVTKEGDNVIEPTFTFHGYRYMEITGLEGPLAVENVKGKVISSIHELAADYETSNEKVNRLFQNIVWSQYGNFLSIPTDCPQRNERMGWSGDISVFGRTSTYLANVDQFFRRHMLAMRDAQYPDGRYADVAPADNGFGGILWGSAGMTVAWETYLQYADRALLEEHYSSMKTYMDFLEKGIDEKTGVQAAGMLGDWLSPEGNKNDNTLLFSAYYVFDLEIMARTAEILGFDEDASSYWQQYEDRKQHFNATYFDPQEGKTLKSGFEAPRFGGPPSSASDETNGPQYMDTQVSYAVPLGLGVFNEENAKAAAARLVEIIQSPTVDDAGVTRPANSLMTGFIGTAWISKALSDHGYDDVAYTLLQNEAYPSWLYPVTQGATTIWERLNSYTHEEGFGGNNSMNSFNHYSFGAVGQWLMAYSLGIERGEPGFQEFVLQPTPDKDGNMQWAKGYYDSMYGRIESSWSLDGQQWTCQVVIPPNTTATMYLPTSDKNSVKEMGQSIDESSGLMVEGYEDGELKMRLGSGSYQFTAML